MAAPIPEWDMCIVLVELRDEEIELLCRWTVELNL
jgi:hypothetical protein